MILSSIWAAAGVTNAAAASAAPAINAPRQMQRTDKDIQILPWTLLRPFIAGLIVRSSGALAQTTLILAQRSRSAGKAAAVEEHLLLRRGWTAERGIAMREA